MKNQKLEAKSVATTGVGEVDVTRRKVIHGAGLVAGGSLMGLATGGVWAAGSDKPEKT